MNCSRISHNANKSNADVSLEKELSVVLMELFVAPSVDDKSIDHVCGTNDVAVRHRYPPTCCLHPV